MLRGIPKLTAQARALLTAMNLHFAGVAGLAVLVLYFAAHLIFIAQALSARNADALDQQRVQLKAAEIAAKPLRGLDVKLENSTKAADAFYAKRLPFAYSEFLTELGALTKKEDVRLSRVQYAPAAVLSGKDALTEVQMDASISGDYRPMVQLINVLERDKMFFVIKSISLTGQQTGQVNARLRLVTYMREPNAVEVNSDIATPDLDTSKKDATGGSR
jgi:type IV pilus assembly protein PilO